MVEDTKIKLFFNRIKQSKFFRSLKSRSVYQIIFLLLIILTITISVIFSQYPQILSGKAAPPKQQCGMIGQQCCKGDICSELQGDVRCYAKDAGSPRTCQKLELVCDKGISTPCCQIGALCPASGPGLACGPNPDIFPPDEKYKNPWDTGTCKNVIRAPVPPVSASNIFGIMTWGTNISTRMDIANTLGAKYYRPSSVFLNVVSGSKNQPMICDDCIPAKTAGLKLILTVRYDDGTNPPPNLDTYKTQLTKVVNDFNPEVLVIENEENSSLFYSGTPDQYLAELKAGCEVARSKNIKCTNGGLVSKLVVNLVADSYKNDPASTNSTDNYLKRALDPNDYDTLNDQCDKDQYGRKIPTKCGINSTAVQDQITKGKALLTGYKANGADFANFHWYQVDPETLIEAINYLRMTSGLPVMTNEIGQQNKEPNVNNVDPEQVTNDMQTVFGQNLPYALWFSYDIPTHQQARALTDKDGSMPSPHRDNGKAYQQFIKDHFSPDPTSTPTPTPSPTLTPTPPITNYSCSGTCIPNGENCYQAVSGICQTGKFCCKTIDAPTVTPKPPNTPVPAKAPNGAACTSGMQCTSGICQTCPQDLQGFCRPGGYICRL